MFTANYFGQSYFAPRYFPRNVVFVAVDLDGGASGGRPWPQRTLNILMPRRVIQDDEDFLLIFN